MTKHPKRPRDPAQLAKLIDDIATGEVDDEKSRPTPAQEFARQGGLKGGRARAMKMTPERRREIAQKAARVRWEEPADDEA